MTLHKAITITLVQFHHISATSWPRLEFRRFLTRCEQPTGSYSISNTRFQCLWYVALDMHDFDTCIVSYWTTDSSDIFSFLGVEIDDCMMIVDNDRMFFSQGASFIHLKTKRGSRESNSLLEQISDTLADVGPYTVGELLGRGGFGEVREGTNQLTGEIIALKFLKKSEIMSVGAAERTSTEIQCLSTLNHPNIIRLHVVRQSPAFVSLFFVFWPWLVFCFTLLCYVRSRSMFTAHTLPSF